MVVVLKCPQCDRLLEIPDQYRGQVGKCSTCGGRIEVPRRSRTWPIKSIGIACFGGLVFFVGGMLVARHPLFLSTTQAHDKNEVFSDASSNTKHSNLSGLTEYPNEITFEEIKLYSLRSTELQWKDFGLSLYGKRVTWTGSVLGAEAVHTSAGERFKVQVHMSFRNQSGIAGFVTLNASEEMARSVSVGQKVQFTGAISVVTRHDSTCIFVLSDCQFV